MEEMSKRIPIGNLLRVLRAGAPQANVAAFAYEGLPVPKQINTKKRVHQHEQGKTHLRHEVSVSLNPFFWQVLHRIELHKYLMIGSAQREPAWDKNYKGRLYRICYTLAMTSINPYINFNGNAEEALTFYKSVFGGEFSSIVRFKDLASDEFPVPEAEADKIMRIVLPIGNSMLIANDVPQAMGRVSESENRSKIAVATESKEEAERIFAGLSVGGAVEMPMAQSPWGTYFAMFRDKYGIEWTVEYSLNA